MSDDELELDLTGIQVAVNDVPLHTFRTGVAQVIAQDDLVIDLTNATTDLYPDLPPWAENESKDFYVLFSAGSIDKGADLIRRKRIEEFKDGFWHVEGSELYVVQVIENQYGGVPWTTCTCPNGQARSSRPTCYHSAAVLMRVLKLGPAQECSNCGERNMETDACPNIKHECLDCCGCPDH